MYESYDPKVFTYSFAVWTSKKINFSANWSVKLFNWENLEYSYDNNTSWNIAVFCNKVNNVSASRRHLNKPFLFLLIMTFSDSDKNGPSSYRRWDHNHISYIAKYLLYDKRSGDYKRVCISQILICVIYEKTKSICCFSIGIRQYKILIFSCMHFSRRTRQED